MHYIELRGVCKTYSDGQEPAVVLSDLTFTVARGEFVAVTGPSGCGKSTLLHIVGGLGQPTSGDVLIDGKPLYKKSQAQLAQYRRRGVGIVYQFYNLVPELTAEENLMLPARMGRLAMSREQVDRILDFLGMQGKGHLYPSQLSGGQQQKIAIGRALAYHPPLLLADEPTGNLDTLKRDGILELFRYLNQKEGMTILLATHDPTAAQAAGRCIRLLDGKLAGDKEGDCKR